MLNQVVVLFTVLSSLQLGHFTCPDGTDYLPPILGSNWPCVSVDRNQLSINDAQIHCKIRNGSLMSIPNGYVNSLVADFVEDANVLIHRAHIGVTRLSGDVWKNMDDGSDTVFFDWASGEPKNNTGFYCVQIDSKGYWYSDLCATGHFVCGLPDSQQ